MTLKPLFAPMALGALMLSSLAGGSAQATPSGTLQLKQAAPAQTLVETVQFRRPGYYGARPLYAAPRYGGPRYYGWRGPGAWAGVAAGVAIGALIYSTTYLPRRGYYYDTYAYDGPYYYPEGYTGDPRNICARYFKSFEWDSGMYTTYGGQRKLCPYLRQY